MMPAEEKQQSHDPSAWVPVKREKSRSKNKKREIWNSHVTTHKRL
jgi:hypothetical protein